MNASTISILCKLLPPPELDVVQDNFRINSVESILGVSDPKHERFVAAYGDLQFGWNFARTMALNKLPLTYALDGRDNWVWKAYLYCLNTDTYRDQDLLRAMTFMSGTQAKNRAVMNALLMAPDMDFGKIAIKMNVSVAVVEAYEVLFFNIWDRRADGAFLADIVYPNGRMVEFAEKYTMSEPLEMLLMRAGFNNGSDDMLYLAGFPSRLLDKFSGKDSPQRLEAMAMGNGLILARNGWLNQGSGSGGLRSALSLIAAAKQGGGDEAQSPFYVKGAGQTLLAEIQRVKTLQNEKRSVAFYRHVKDSNEALKSPMEASAN